MEGEVLLAFVGLRAAAVGALVLLDRLVREVVAIENPFELEALLAVVITATEGLLGRLGGRFKWGRVAGGLGALGVAAQAVPVSTGRGIHRCFHCRHVDFTQECDLALGVGY